MMTSKEVKIRSLDSQEAAREGRHYELAVRLCQNHDGQLDSPLAYFNALLGSQRLEPKRLTG